jgi:hypothetical protein
MERSTISKELKEDAKILAIKSPDKSIEECLKNKHMNAEKIMKKRTQMSKIRKIRTKKGNGLYVEAGIEPVVKRDEVGTKNYNVRIYPSTGTAQIIGVRHPLSSGRDALEYCLSKISLSTNMPPFKVLSEKINMMNFKFEILGQSYELLRLNKISEIFEALIPTSEIPIVFITNRFECTSHMYIKFHTPLPHDESRCTSLKVYVKRKITMFAAYTYEIATKIHTYFDTIVSQHRNEIMCDTRERPKSKIPVAQMLF